MRWKLMAAVLLMACVSWATRSEASQYEKLLVVVPDNFELGYTAENKTSSIAEYVPKGQTVKNWTEMVTSQSFHGLGTVTAKQFVEAMSEDITKKTRKGLCVISPLDMSKYSTYPSYAVIWMVGQVGDTKQGEITLIRAFQGKDSLYVVQRAWRVPSFDPNKDLPLSDKALKEGMLSMMQAQVADSRKTDVSKINPELPQHFATPPASEDEKNETAPTSGSDAKEN
jgi:hypothetical protein